MPSFYEGKGYVFLQLKISKIGDYENEYRPKKQALLEIACAAAKNKFEHLKTIIGIAIDAPKFSRINSEDFILMDCSDWPDDRREHYEKANKGLEFFNTNSLSIQKRKVGEFPPVETKRKQYKKKIGRNDPCPCGSGKKYKKCCLNS